MTTCARCFMIFPRHVMVLVNKTTYCEPCVDHLRAFGLLPKENNP